MVVLAPAAAGRIARPWLQKANAPLTGSLPGTAVAKGLHARAVLFDAHRSWPGKIQRAARGIGDGPVGHDHLPFGGLVGLAGGQRRRNGSPDLSTLLQLSTLKSTRTCQEIKSEEPP